MNQLTNLCEYEKAIAYADSILPADSSYEVIIAKSRALAALSRYPDAINNLKIKFDKDTLSKSLLIELYRISWQSGNNDAAFKYCKKLVDYFPENEYFRLQLIGLYMADKKYQTAKELLIPVFLKDTTNYFVIKQLATCYEELDQLYSARIFCLKALEVSKFDRTMTYRLANVLIKNKNIKEAHDLTRSFLDHDSTYLPVKKQYAYTCYLLEEFEMSLKEFQECAAAGDTSVFVMKYTGLSYYRQQKFDSAAPIFKKAFGTDSTDVYLCFYYAVSEFRAKVVPGAADSAVRYLELADSRLQPSPKFIALIYKEMGSAYEEKGNAEKAVECYLEALGKNPEENRIRFLVAYQYDYYLNKPDEAAAFYSEFLSRNDSSEPAGFISSSITKGKANDEVEMTISLAQFATDRLAVLRKHKK